MTAMYGTVVRTERLSPRLVRVVLGGDGLAGFTATDFTDQYISALFRPDDAPYSVPFNVDEVRATAPDHQPRRRRETVRRWDPGSGELTLDIVTHGDEGHAGRWANRAQPGDRLQVTSATGGYAPRADADWHLMVGDESAVPAIAASLEQIRSAVPVLAVLVVDGPNDHVELPTPAGLQVTWVHRAVNADDPDALLHAVEGLTFPTGVPQVFVHGEAAEVRAIRKHLLGDRAVPKDGQSISPYWRRTKTDEEWREIKRQWLAESEADV